MPERGLVASKAKLYPPKKGNNGMVNSSPNVIHELKVDQPNQVWVGDITYIKLENGQWQYLTAIMDRFTRQIISWSIFNTLKIESIKQESLDSEKVFPEEAAQLYAL